MTKKRISLLLAIFMVLALIPLGASAKSVTGSRAAAPVHATKDVDVDGSLLYEDFDGDSLNNDGWWLYNADGGTATYGGNNFSNWVWMTLGAGEAHTGSDCMASFSYYSGNSWNQDNWLVTPNLTIPAAGYWLSCYVEAYSSYYPDQLSILVGEYGVAYDDETITTSAWNVEIPLTDSPAAWNQWTVDLSAYAGKTIAIAFRHVDYDAWGVLLDTINVGIAGNPPEPTATPEPTPEPTAEPDLGDLIEGYYFEDAAEVAEWNFVDDDGDGFTWMWNQDYPFEGLDGDVAFEGSGNIISESYSNDPDYGTKYGALSPDNWAVSPAFAVPSEAGYVTFYATTYGNYGYEHLAAYVGTTDNIANMVEVLPETAVTACTTSSANYARYLVDVSDYAGQTIYFAIRHFNSNDIFILGVDQVEFWGIGNVEPPEPEIYEVTFVDGLTGEVLLVQEVEEGSDASAPAAPAHEGYTFIGWDNEYTNVTGNITVTAQYEINYYTLTINYVDEDGNKVAAAYVGTYAYNAEYEVASPEIPGYVPSQAVVSGTMGAADVEVNVVYSPEEVPPVEVLPGDANADGVLTSADLSALFAYVMNAGSLTEQGLLNADVNGDGVINTLDVTVLAQLIFGA